MFYFVPNLKPYTYHRGSGNRRFGCYLLSTDYADSQHDVLSKLSKSGELLVADNGNFDLIGDFIKDNVSEANSLADMRKQIERELDGYVRPGDLSNDLIARYRKLAESISMEARTLTPETYVQGVIRAQSRMRPTFIVAMEDFTIPALLGLSIEPQYLDYPLDWYAQHTSTALEFALNTQAQRYGDIDATVFAGVHAIDFDTAFQAGRLVGQAGVSAVATGLGSSLNDRDWIDYRVIHGEVIPFDAPVPRAYVRVMEIVCGLSLGYSTETGKRLAIHGLGVGTPILVLLMGLLGSEGTFLAIDSTSPIKDAYSSKTISLYVDTPAPRKLKAHRIIEYWLRDDLGWECKCPYCAQINREYPPQVEAARSWWTSVGYPSIGSGDLYGDHPLANFFPLLSNPASDELRSEVGHARIGHNHWVLKRIEKQARDYGENIDHRLDRVNHSINAYLSAAGGSGGWNRAVSIAWDITRQTALELEGMEEGLTF